MSHQRSSENGFSSFNRKNHVVNLAEKTLDCSITRERSTQPHNKHWRKKFRSVETKHQLELYHQQSVGKITTSHFYPSTKRENSRFRQKPFVRVTQKSRDPNSVEYRAE